MREATQTPARLLLMIHGFTGDENSMWVFARNLPAECALLAPRGIYAAPQGGYSWRAYREGTFGKPSLADFQDSAGRLLRLVDEYQVQAGIEASQFDAIGFSQGAAMCNVLACLYPQRVRKVGILAGFVPFGMDEWIAKKTLAGKPYFVTHGAQDTTVTIERGRASVALLEQAGANVTYCESDAGHKVSRDCLRALETFFRGED
ncbi:MAG: hypothetical protein HFACDABA_03005 [Anaerolineales bacterium]|nr:hypothetical protein [Anaerolineales bacterium]